jgi:hypothetical protein
VAVNPGKTKTTGMPGVLGGTTHQLTLDDAEALRRVPAVEQVVPVAFGAASVEGGGRSRSVILYGVNHEAAAAWRFAVAQGSFLPRMDPRRRASYAVLGARLARELFGNASSPGAGCGSAATRAGDRRLSRPAAGLTSTTPLTSRWRRTSSTSPSCTRSTWWRRTPR